MKSNSPHKPSPAPTASGNKPDPKETAQESIHQVMSKADAQAVKIKAASKVDATAPLRAAKGDDDLMSTPQKKS